MDSPDEPTLVQQIESKTMRKLTMETSLAENFTKCHPQDQSPLYNKIPKEIRDLIFEFATAPYEDLREEQRYPENSYYYRPDLRGPLRSSTGLLGTCRRVWLESSNLPMKQNVAVIWRHSERGPPKQLEDFFAQYWTSLNHQNFRNVRLFAQKHLVERIFLDRDTIDLLPYHTPKPRHLRITWRHTDWNRWEDPLPLELDDGWIQHALNNASWMSEVECLEIELETLEIYKDQLLPIVDRLCRLEGRPKRSTLPSEPTIQLKIIGPARFWRWNGPPNIDNKQWPAHAGLEQLDYKVAVLTWRAVITDAEPAETFDDPSLRVFDQDRLRAPFRRLDYRARRQWHQAGWKDLDYPSADYILRMQEIHRSNAQEDERRYWLQKGIADIKARELEKAWRANKSLLKFDFSQDTSLNYNQIYHVDVLDDFNFDAFEGYDIEPQSLYEQSGLADLQPVDDFFTVMQE